MRPAGRLVALWIRSSERWWAGLLVGLICALLTSIYIVLNAFVLSGPQAAEQALGSADYQVTLGARGPGDSDVPRHVGRALDESGATDVRVMTIVRGLPLDGVRVSGLATGLQDVLSLRQYEEGGRPSYLSLVDGRWPQRPGEVVVSERLSGRIPATLTAFSGGLRLEVVGVYQNRYATQAFSLISAVGTWELVPAVRAERFAVDASTVVSWRGDPRRALQVIARVSGEPEDVLQTSFISRERYLEDPPRTLVERIPALLTYPSMALSLVAGLTVAGLIAPKLRRQQESLGRVGLPRASTLSSGLAVVSAVVMGSAVAGVAVGVAIGALLRTTVVPMVLTQPISPFPAVGATAVVMVACSVLGAAGMTLLRMAPRRGGAEPMAEAGPKSPAPWSTVLRHGAVLGLTILLVANADQADNGLTEAVLFGFGLTVLAAMLVPDVVGLAVRLVWVPGVSGMMASRLLAWQRGRVAGIAVIMAVTMGFPASLGIMVATVQYSTAAQSVLPPGQAVLSADNGLPDQSVVEAVETAAGLETPVLVSRWEGFMVGSQSNAFGIIVVDSVADLERINGGPVSESTAQAFEAGALVDFSGAEGDLAVEVGESRQPVPTVHEDFSPAWARIAGGALIAHSAEALGGRTRPESLLYTGVTDAQIAEMTQAIVDAGHNPGMLTFHAPPPPPETPWEMVGATVLFGLVGVFSAFLTTRALGRAMRRHGAQFLAVGLPGRTARVVLTAQIGLLLAIVVPLALIVGLLPSVLFVAARHDYTLYVPAITLMAAVGCIVAVMGFASLGALAGIRARDRLADTLV
ncbi:hypothetical protein CGZ92_05775 [Parenemella sanctibonifatiensis]|uniref:FtsX-like permease family protein n=2 Tax=Parenemella sanctibonifatiensis TaxID=2016505 RepID=A0A255E882_9ACTN|nr:hypothetical protein CGZ92_05775 [Parenemella sanctibonifatiensis]